MRDADEDATFIFTGHSKGGIFAQIAGIIAMGSEVRQNISVVSYGVPPIFSATGATVIGDNMYEAFLRVSKEDDPIVTYNPLPRSCNIGMGYMLSQSTSDIAESGFDSIDTMPTRDEVLTRLQTHKMPGYLRSVENITLDECLH